MREQGRSTKGGHAAVRKRTHQLLFRSAVFLLFVLLLLCVGWAPAEPDAGEQVIAGSGGAPLALPHSPLFLSATGTRVGLEPSSLKLEVGDVVTVSVLVHDAVDLYGFVLTMSFDPNVIQIVDTDPSREGINVSWGDFLVPSQTPLNICDNVTGTIKAAASQVYLPPRSGSGRLISVIFEAVGAGDVAFRFEEVALSDDQGMLPDTEILPHTHTVTGPTPTPTPTSGPTLTPGPSPTPYFCLDPQLLELRQGDTGEMVIRTSSVEGLGGVTVYLNWDAGLIEVVDADPLKDGVQVLPGDLFLGYDTEQPPDGNRADKTAGQLLYILSLSTGPGVDGQWSVATVRFHALENGVCAVEFAAGTKMASWETGDIPTGWIDGQVRVADQTATPTATPTAAATSSGTVPAAGTSTPTVTPQSTSSPSPTPTGVGTVSQPTPTTEAAERLRFPIIMKGYTGLPGGL